MKKSRYIFIALFWALFLTIMALRIYNAGRPYEVVPDGFEASDGYVRIFSNFEWNNVNLLLILVQFLYGVLPVFLPWGIWLHRKRKLNMSVDKWFLLLVVLFTCGYSIWDQSLLAGSSTMPDYEVADENLSATFLAFQCLYVLSILICYLYIIVKAIIKLVKMIVQKSPQKKVVFPSAICSGKFASLYDAVEFLNKIKNMPINYTLREIVLYNVIYRNYLRDNGVDKLIELLVKDAPQLKELTPQLTSLRNDLADVKIADYDIQCYGIYDEVTIMGHTFKGLNEIVNYVEMYGLSSTSSLSCQPQEKHLSGDVHVGCIYMPYPKFDSFDFADNRCYQNYIFSSKPISEKMIATAHKNSGKYDYCMVHEEIPEDQLPIFYYSGTGNHMLLASKKK